MLGHDDQALALGALLLHGACQIPVHLRMDVAEAQILQFPLELPDAQPVGQGRKDVQRLACDPFALVGRLAAQGAHVVQTIGQLDEHHARIFHHGQEHLAQGLGLGVGHARLGIAQIADALQLGHAVDQRGHGRPELGTDVVDPELGVLGHVVEQAGGQCVHIHVQRLVEDRGHGQGMDHVRLAALTTLVAMGIAGDHIRLGHSFKVAFGEHAGQMPDQVVEALQFLRLGIDGDEALLVGRGHFGVKMLHHLQRSAVAGDAVVPRAQHLFVVGV